MAIGTKTVHESHTSHQGGLAGTQLTSSPNHPRSQWILTTCRSKGRQGAKLQKGMKWCSCLLRSTFLMNHHQGQLMSHLSEGKLGWKLNMSHHRMLANDICIQWLLHHQLIKLIAVACHAIFLFLESLTLYHVKIIIPPDKTKFFGERGRS